MNKTIRIIYYFILPISLWLMILFQNYIYENMILRGLGEAVVWIEQIEKGNYAPLYYHIIYEFINQTTYTLLDISLGLSITCLMILLIFSCFERKFFLLISYSFLSILPLSLILSPGRTGITLFIVFFTTFFLCERKYLLFSLGFIILFFLHSGTAFFISTIMIGIIFDLNFSRRFCGFFSKIIYNMFCAIVISIALILVVYSVSGGFYDNTRGYSYFSAALSLVLFFGWFPFVDRRQFILLALAFVVALFIMKINPIYLFRIIIIPTMIVMGVNYVCRGSKFVNN